MKKDAFAEYSTSQIMDVQISGWPNYICHSKWHPLQIPRFLKFLSRISQFVLIFPHLGEKFSMVIVSIIQPYN